MKFKRYLGLLSLSSFLCWASWLVVLFKTSPEEASYVGKTLFYFSLSLAIFGTMMVVQFCWLSAINNLENTPTKLSPVLQRSFFLTVILISLLAGLHDGFVLGWPVFLFVSSLIIFLLKSFLNFKRKSFLK